MTYIVLARKWRPMRFEEVIGQEHATSTLMNALEQKRLGHAFIMAGPRGIGKTTTARLLAKAVNCLTPDGVNPCNNCDTCQTINTGQYLDVIEIDGASNRGIDEIRNLRENIRFSPAVGRYKVYIIDEIHMLSKEAFNALLKTLEEPPAHAIFIFATTEIHRVPLTILSRCQRFDFRRIPTRMITDQLSAIASQEKIDIEEAALLLIARKADGGMRDATSILDQLSSFSQGQISVSQVQETLGVLGEDVYFEYTRLMHEKNDAEILGYSERLFARGQDVMSYLEGLEHHFRNLLIASATGTAKGIETSDFYREQYESAADGFNKKDLLHILDILLQHEQRLKYSENPQLSLELLLLKLAHKPLSVDIEELLALLKRSPGAAPSSGKGGTPPAQPNPSRGKPKTSKPVDESKKSHAESTSGSPDTSVKATANSIQPAKSPGAALGKLPRLRPAAAANPTPLKADTAMPVRSDITLAGIQKQWPAVLSAVKKEKIVLASFLQDGVPHQLENHQLQVAFDTQNSFHQDHVVKNTTVIEKVLKSVFKAPLKIVCIRIDFSKKGIQKPTQSPEEAFESMKNKEPVLRKIIELFDCENLD